MCCINLTSTCHAWDLDINSIYNTDFSISSLQYLVNITHSTHPKLTSHLSSVPQPQYLFPVVVLVLVNKNNSDHILLILSTKTLVSTLISFFPLAFSYNPLILKYTQIWQLPIWVHHSFSFYSIIIKAPTWSSHLGHSSLSVSCQQRKKTRIILLNIYFRPWPYPDQNPLVVSYITQSIANSFAMIYNMLHDLVPFCIRSYLLHFSPLVSTLAGDLFAFLQTSEHTHIPSSGLLTRCFFCLKCSLPRNSWDSSLATFNLYLNTDFFQSKFLAILLKLQSPLRLLFFFYPLPIFSLLLSTYSI